MSEKEKQVMQLLKTVYPNMTERDKGYMEGTIATAAAMSKKQQEETEVETDKDKEKTA